MKLKELYAIMKRVDRLRHDIEVQTVIRDGMPADYGRFRRNQHIKGLEQELEEVLNTEIGEV